MSKDQNQSDLQAGIAFILKLDQLLAAAEEAKRPSPLETLSDRMAWLYEEASSEDEFQQALGRDLRLKTGVAEWPAVKEILAAA